MELYEALKKYYSIFNDNFPVAEFRGVPNDEKIKIINDCIKRNEPCRSVYSLLEDE